MKKTVKSIIAVAAILTVMLFFKNSTVNASALEPVELNRVEQVAPLAGVPSNQPWRMWHGRWMTANASRPASTRYVTQNAYGVQYRGYLTITRKTDGQQTAYYEGWLYHPNYSGGNLPIPAKVTEEK